MHASRRPVCAISLMNTVSSCGVLDKHLSVAEYPSSQSQRASPSLMETQSPLSLQSLRLEHTVKAVGTTSATTTPKTTNDARPSNRSCARMIQPECHSTDITSEYIDGC
eukprot:m.261477 g.261477  ORF g.261477 m.261477 type:complete len:109 (+) comp42206_c0_seq1:1418-1744(+)